MDRSAEDEADAAGPKILLDVIPKALGVEFVTEARPEYILWLLTFLRTAALEVGAEPLSRPIDDAVRRVVEQLSDHLAPDPRVVAALDLDQRWHRLLVYEEVVERPAAATRLPIGDADLPLHEKPAP